MERAGQGTQTIKKILDNAPGALLGRFANLRFTSTTFGPESVAREAKLIFYPAKSTLDVKE